MRDSHKVFTQRLSFSAAQVCVNLAPLLPFLDEKKLRQADAMCVAVLASYLASYLFEHFS
ncbi:MAG: hypothetical protein HOP19_22065 [Acidobacteria bacterium]|nr:hypothetical protein [Acidobacteriota bacterium]